jgi:hypothetical protein
MLFNVHSVAVRVYAADKIVSRPVNGSLGIAEARSAKHAARMYGLVLCVHDAIGDIYMRPCDRKLCTSLERWKRWS